MLLDGTFEFLDVSKTNRRSRLSCVLKTLTEEEIKTFVLPRISSCIALYDIVREQALITSNRSDSGQRISSSKLDILLHQFVKKLSETHPNELNNVLLSYGYTKKFRHSHEYHYKILQTAIFKFVVLSSSIVLQFQYHPL